MALFLRSAVIVSLAGFAVSLANMGSHLVLARTFGADVEIDSFFAGLSLPLLVGGLLSGAVGYQVVPMLMHFRGDGGAVRDYRSGLVFCGIVCGLILTLVGGFSSWWILGHYPNAVVLRAHSADLIAWTGWGAASAILITALLTAISQSQRQFTRPALINGIAPLLSIIASWWAGTHGHSVVVVAAALMAGHALASLFLLFRLRREISLTLPRPEVLARVLRDLRAGPMVFASMLTFTCFGAVDAYLGGNLDEGTVTCLAYAQRILVALAGLAVNGVGVVMLPTLSESAARGDRRQAAADMGVTLRSVLVVMAPTAIVGALLAGPSTRLLFGGGQFDDADTARLAAVLPYMLAGMVPMSCSAMLFKGLYAIRDNAGAAIVGVAGAAIYTTLCALLVGQGLGVRGFGIAYILCWCAVLLFSAVRLARGLQSALFPPGALAWLGRLFVALLLVALSVLAAQSVLMARLDGGRTAMGIRVLEIVSLAVGTYLAAGYFLKLHEIRRIVLAVAAKCHSGGTPQ